MRSMNIPEETVVSEVFDPMKTRILTACVCVPMAVAVLWLAVYFPWMFTVTLLALCFIGIHEALKTAGADSVKIIYAPCFAYGAVVLLAPYITDKVKMYGAVMAASMVFLFVMFGILLKKHSVLRIEKICTSMILTMFVAIPFMVLELIFGVSLKSDCGASAHAVGLALTVYCLVVAWMADIGAYFIGRAFGKHKLAPVLSPKKTIEGSVGGFVISMIFSVGVAYLYSDVFHGTPNGVNFLNLTIITAICILMSMFGDISFSTVKRQYGIKDFGTLLPGHGGVLDRFDSVLFVCPTFFMLNYLLPVLK